MPTYEYRCPECGTDFEKFQKMSDPPGAPCPSCGADADRRMSAGAGLVFKGSGFYITDYRGEGYKKAAQADGGASPSSESKPSESKGDSGGGESKPAPRADPAPAPKSESKPPPKAG